MAAALCALGPAAVLATAIPGSAGLPVEQTVLTDAPNVPPPIHPHHTRAGGGEPGSA
jgi:hypothetical protein